MDGIDIYELDYPTHEGVRLPKVEPLLRDAGKVINDIQDLKLGPEAVILATFPRSGTHWVYEITHMLLTRNANYNTVSREATFLEGLPDLGPLQFYNHIVSTHLQFKWLPKQHVERGGKIIYVIRNPKDVAVSFFEVMRSCGLLREETFEYFLSEFYLGKRAIYGGWFQYNQTFIREAKARKDQIIMLQYETLKNNTLKELKRLAEFLEVKIADPLLKEIAEKCQFDNLKTADKSVRNDEALSKIMRAVSLNEHPTIYRKGEIGDWKNYFTVAMSEAFDKTKADNMDDIGLEFEFE
ncbi:sulfotransferase 1B1-like [Crassostrea angulata]|uniref:sulfotransferase 1B1-like n=1 Tax=Magallana angulata TaxID=2784310 RepID=UPI0022B0CC20|nr:sulfotransferase 1B1-like [Crassostrea angulata]